MHKRIMALLVVAMAGLLSACGFAPESSLKVGAKAPAIQTKTLADVGGDFSRITSYRYPDERMYQYSLDEALQKGRPILVEFATPGHCTVCDVQLQMLKSLVSKYDPEILFLHMDQYENPGAFKAFNVKGDPWTYLIDANGIVQFKQPGRMLYGELEKQIERVRVSGQG